MREGYLEHLKRKTGITHKRVSENGNLFDVLFDRDGKEILRGAVDKFGYPDAKLVSYIWQAEYPFTRGDGNA